MAAGQERYDLMKWASGKLVIVSVLTGIWTNKSDIVCSKIQGIGMVTQWPKEDNNGRCAPGSFTGNIESINIRLRP